MNPNTPLRLSDAIARMPGYPLGLGQPALRAEIVLSGPLAPDFAKLDALFAELLGKPIAPDAAGSLPLAILRWNRAVQSAARWPTFTDGMTAPDGDATTTHALLVPCLTGGFRQAAQALGWVVEVVNAALADAPLDAVRGKFPAVLTALYSVSPGGMNSLRFIQAAQAAGVPWRRVLGNVYQYGWGARACWLDSSFTEHTSNIGSVLARNKFKAAAVLRQAGVAVPAHFQVRDADDAVKVAGTLGYPVVIKPANLDGGAGVRPGLRTEAAVRRAYDEARNLSPAVMVEKHIEGNDYRIQVFRGEPVWASHRVPGGVTGDGVSDVTELLRTLNADPLRGPVGGEDLLKRIELNEEAVEMLAELGLTPESVPEKDRFIRLRRAANVASGGVPVPALDRAHPDNLALAARAAKALRLDLAGVDLLIPDIARSWLETGAAVCEVNAQPQLWPTLPALLLKKLVKGQGRIPVIVVLGSDTDFASQLGLKFGESGLRVGIAGPNGATLGGATVMRGPCEVLSSGGALLVNPEVDLLILHLDDFDAARKGLLVDRFNLLILAGGPPAGSDWEHWLAFARGLSGVCGGAVLANDACPEWVPLLSSIKGRHTQSAPLAGLMEIVAGSLKKKP